MVTVEKAVKHGLVYQIKADVFSVITALKINLSGGCKGQGPGFFNALPKGSQGKNPAPVGVYLSAFTASAGMKNKTVFYLIEPLHRQPLFVSIGIAPGHQHHSEGSTFIYFQMNTKRGCRCRGSIR